jgi:phage gpG-like protein
VRLYAEIDGEKGIDYAIDAISDGVSDWREVWPEVERIFYVATLAQFRTEGQRGGSPWRPLSSGYRKWKEVKAPGQPILVLTGRLRKSLTAVGNQDTIRDQQPMALTLGTSTPYGIFHQRGTRKMPARPPLVLLKNDYGKMVSRMFRYAQKVGKDAGFQTQGRAQFTPGAE